MKRQMLLRFLILLVAAFIIACGSDEKKNNDLSIEADNEKSIRERNLEIQEGQLDNRAPCDTLHLAQHIIDNYPDGTYLVYTDQSYTLSVPKAAVIYRDAGEGRKLIYGLVAKSKPGERLIETKNVIGYSSSFINLDSTKLGTAFFFLTLFECNTDNEDFKQLWESEVPIHGGFSSITWKTWNKIPYIQLKYVDGIISGHRMYNFFFSAGVENPPHLLETYEGLLHKRTLADINKDSIPDYFEYRFEESAQRIRILDSVPFVWRPEEDLYISPQNRRWWREY